MSDTPPERNSNSKSNLIEVQHVGVTAKLQSPLKSFLQSGSSSTETENGQVLFHDHHTHKTKYNKFSNDTQADTETTTDTSKVLYEMRAVRDAKGKRAAKTTITPSKIEFQLYRQRHAARGVRRTRCSTGAAAFCKRKKPKRKLFIEVNGKTRCHCKAMGEASILQRLRRSLESMRKSRPTTKSKPATANIFDDLPEPTTGKMHNEYCADSQKDHNCADHNFEPRETRIGIYPFEHGCAEYLRTTDCHPQILSMVLAERATHYATRFWAEFFGSLHIGVTFVVTFMLQTYRFLLYSLVNTLVVGFLHMTSDYLIKPILTVLFNGFLQPPLILIYNVLTSIRDILEPVADTINNFMRPVATVGKSLRIVHVSYNQRKLTKDV